MRTLMSENDRSELLGQLIDTVEDCFTANKENTNDTAIVKDEKYDALKKGFESTLKNWNLLPETTAQKNTIFLLLGSKDSGIFEFADTLRTRGWIIPEHASDNENADALIASPDNYFKILKNIKTKRTNIETVIFPPENGENEDGAFIWYSEEEKYAFETIFSQIEDADDICYDYIKLRSTETELSPDRNEQVALFLEQTRRVYQNFDRILDQMLENKLIFCKEDDPNQLSIQNADHPSYINRQTLISNFIRQTNESAQYISQFLLYYMASCEM